MTHSGVLQQLADIHGVQLSYYDISGRQHEASPDSLMAVLHVLGVSLNQEADAESALAAHIEQPAAIEPVLVAWNGWLHHFLVRTANPQSIRYVLHLEDGSAREGELQLEHTHEGLRGTIPENLPLGYHHLELNTPEAAAALIISAPWRAHSGQTQQRDRSWGTFLPLYAVRAARNQGIGDYTSLATLTRWTGQLGAKYFGTLPLLATFVDAPFDPSPYAPISRLFWSEVFLDVQAATALADANREVVLANGEFATTVAKLNACDLVDYKEV